MTSHPSLDSTPPSKLFRQWENDILNERENVDVVLDTVYRTGFIAGADAELEACCEWLVVGQWFSPDGECLKDLRAARRPKPPSLKAQALCHLESFAGSIETLGMDSDLIRRAIEALPD